MIIGIDGNEANVSRRTGSGQYAFNLLHSLAKIDREHIFYIYLKSAPLSDLPPQNQSWHYVVLKPQKLWTKIALPLRLLFNPQKLDLFYSPGHYLPAFSKIKLIPTIHDIGYLQYQDQFTKKDLYQLINWTQSSLKQASHIIAVSEFTKKELQKEYKIPPQKISIVYNGINSPQKITNTDIQQTLRKFKINHPYFLALGTLKPNKNYPFLIESFSNFLKLSNTKALSYQLVIAGKKGWLFDDIQKVLKKLKIKNEVIFTDYISEKEKDCLYSQAISLIIPSTYEGFGIPAIEAQIRHCPVIASNIPPLSEVLGDSALFIDPKKTKTLTDAFKKITQKAIREKLIKSGLVNASRFTWDNSAKQLISVFNQV